FSNVFDNAFPGKTFLQVLSQGGGGLNSLGRHIISALLNSSAIDGYPGTPTDVIDAFNNVFEGTKSQYNTLTAQYEALQDPCPLN
ncbi:MAG: hypothetical protein AAB861_02640, partial [Patescibacteria group bacterium]